jgi:hypothetical protein
MTCFGNVRKNQPVLMFTIAKLERAFPAIAVVKVEKAVIVVCDMPRPAYQLPRPCYQEYRPLASEAKVWTIQKPVERV